ncbi:hypothetical protein FIBSPDRAFT_964514 [Athelia psychrophila]|uniref:Uncharacterized protein n=1 Tax=Athelia psychrophila TaxID=1759441 RepID=A0A165XQK2_9AGAM|nr:hypothetical protein FIBSPDRAFT_964514 [Fibularhizoctonia sp. CBS 109695]
MAYLVCFPLADGGKKPVYDHQLRIQLQIHDVQSSLASYVGKAQALEGVFDKQEHIKREVSGLSAARTGQQPVDEEDEAPGSLRPELGRSRRPEQPHLGIAYLQVDEECQAVAIRSQSIHDDMPGLPLRTWYAAQCERIKTHGKGHMPIPLILESFPGRCPSCYPPSPSPHPG